MTREELAKPDNEADCTVSIRISGNRLVSVLNTLDCTLHATGKYRFVGDEVRGMSSWYDDLRTVTEAIRDELSIQRNAARIP